jgi:hypothetical protein
MTTQGQNRLVSSNATMLNDLNAWIDEKKARAAQQSASSHSAPHQTPSHSALPHSALNLPSVGQMFDEEKIKQDLLNILRKTSPARHANAPKREHPVAA